MTTPRNSGALCALLAATATCGLAPQAATAQNTSPQKEYYLDEGEVDLYGGTYRYSSIDLVAGPAGEGGLSFVRYGNARDSGTGSVGSTSAHSLDAFVHRESYREDAAGAAQNSYNFHVVYGRTRETFNWDRYNYPGTVLKNSNGATLTVTNTEHPTPVRYQSKDGTIVSFGTMGGCPSQGIFCSVATSAVSPNGATTRFQYDETQSHRPLKLVSNSYGFGIGFEYTNAAYPYLVTKVCALNLSLVHATKTAPCPAGAPAATYNYTNGNLTSYTDPGGGQTTYSTSASEMRIRWPGSSSDDIVITYNPTSRRVQSRSNRNNATWTYTYQLNEPFESAGTTHNEWTQVTSPLGHKVLHRFNEGAPKPFEIVDAVGRTAQFFYTGNGEHLARKIEPEGNEVHHSYDGRGNATGSTINAKPNSQLAAIVTSAKFPDTCTNPVICNKPEWVKDARGNATVFAYDPVHGGVTHETGPAVGGVQPQKRYIYAQKRAAVRDQNGTLIPSDAVTVLAEERQCLTTGSCTGTADEVRVVYDWGSGNGPLLLRGKVLDPDGLNLRTCYAYDAQGNRLGETSPKGTAGLSSCP